MSSLSRLKNTDSLSQWADKTNLIISSVETFVQTSGSFSSASPAETDLVIYNGTAWVNRVLTGPITINTAGGGATGVLSFKLEDVLISGRTELTSIDSANDFLLIYDASEGSASKIKKVKPSYISTSVGGTNTQFQFNDGGSLAGATGFTYNKTTHAVTATGAMSIAGNLIVNTSVLSVDAAGGKVGINKAAPAFPLDVVGNTNILGTLTVSGTITGTLATAAQTAITSIGTLSALTVSGVSNLSGGTQTTSLSSSAGITVTAGGINVTGGIVGFITTASQTSITAVGTLTGGTWNATVIAGQYGGTGVANTGKTITLGGNVNTAGALTISGAYGLTLTVTGTTSVTLPTSGTLLTSTVSSLSSLTSIGTLSALNVSGDIYFNGQVEENIVDMSSGTEVNCDLGNYFIKTINGNITFTFKNPTASRAYGFTLELTHTSGTVTWPTSVKWPYDTAPTLTAGKTHLFTFITDNTGTRWRGSALVDYVN